MKGFKRFLAIFGLCFGAIIGFVGIFFAIVAISGGFNPDPIDIASMSFLTTGGDTPANEIESISIIDTYTARIYYEPGDASEKQVSLTLVGNGADIVTLSATTVTAGEEFTITPKKRTVEIGEEEYEINVGGEVQIIAKSPNDYKSCKLYITVDVEVPETGLQLLGMDGGEYEYDDSTVLGYKLNRVGDGLFQLSIQTVPSNALEPNTGRYSGAVNIGYKKAYITLPDNSGFEIVGNPATRISYYSAAEKKYFSYSLYNTSATKNTNGTYSLTIGSKTYSDLIITEHYIYTLQLSEDVANGDYSVTAKVFKTYAIQNDFLTMQAAFADHTAPNVNEYATFCNFVAKYKSYVMQSEEGTTFLNSVTNSVGDIQINTLEGYNRAMSFLYVYSSETFILEDIEITSMNTDKTDVSFELHSNTYTTEDSSVVTYDLDSLSKEDIISMFKINLSVVGSATPITKWVGDVVVFSLKGINTETNLDDIIQVNEDGTLSIKETASAYNNGNVINVTYAENIYSIEVLDELITDSSSVLLFATKYGSGDTFTTGYKFCTVGVTAVTTNIASNLIINTNVNTGGINTTMVTNSSSSYGVKQQSFDSTTVLLGAGQTDPTSPLSYSTVKLFAVDESNLFVGTGTTYPKIKLGNSITYVITGSSTVVSAYELPRVGDETDGEYYIRALNNSAENSVKIFAAIVKTDVDGNVVEGDSSTYIFINKSAEVSFDINTYAEASDLKWYVKNNDTYYKKGILSGVDNPDLKLLVYETYDIYVTLYDLDSSGDVVLPTEIETGVNYLYNMSHAFSDFSSNCDTVTSFRANEETGIIVTTDTDGETVVSEQDDIDIKAVLITVETLSTTVGASIEQKKLIAEGYSNNGLELSVSKILITNPVISFEGKISGETDTLALSGTHSLNPLVISKEFYSGAFTWTATSNGVTLTSLNGTTGFSFGLALDYDTDIDVYYDGETNIWSSKIDKAFRTETNLTKYKTNLAAQFATGEGSLTWTSNATTGVATLSGTNNDELTIVGGSFAGETFNISCQINTYKNNGNDETTAVAYLKSREYPVQMNLYVLQTGEVKNDGTTISGENHYLIENAGNVTLALSSASNVLDFTLSDDYYVVGDGNNIITDINVFDALFKGSGYSLETGDRIKLLTGNATFTAGGNTITITNDIISSGELNIVLDDYSATTSISFEIVKKRTNIYTAGMKAGQMVVITSENSTIYNSITESYNDYIVITAEMIASKQIFATLNMGASSTEIGFTVYDEEGSLDDLRFGTTFSSLISEIPEGGSLGLSISSTTRAVFILTNNGGSSENRIVIYSTTDLSTIKLAFDFENNDDFLADIDYVYYDSDGVILLDTAGSLTNKGFLALTDIAEASIDVSASDYSYRTNKQIDVLYNGVSLLAGVTGTGITIESYDSEVSDMRVLNYGGVKFTLTSNATWAVSEGGVVSINYLPLTSGQVEITVSINGDSQQYYSYFTYSA